MSHNTLQGSNATGVRPNARLGRGRRFGGLVGMLTAVAMIASACGGSSSSAKDEITIGAVVPLSGAFAGSGADVKAGAEFAIKELNEAGGIKSLDGRKIALEVADAGGTPESATSAARRIVAKKPVAVIGSWYSSLSLAGTQVAEQARIPWFTASLADDLVSRDFQYTFQLSNRASMLGPEVIRTFNDAVDGDLRVAILIDTNVASKSVKEGLEKALPGGSGGSVVDVQTFAPPLSDATPIVSAALDSSANAIFIGSTSTTDNVQLLKKLAAAKNKLPVIMAAGAAANPDILKAAGAEALEGLIVVMGSLFPGEGAAKLDAKFADFAKRPYMSSEAYSAYVQVRIIAAGLERMSKVDSQELAKAMHTRPIEDDAVLSLLLPKGESISFAAGGARDGVENYILQWQNGRPVVLAPAKFSNAKIR